MTAANASAPVLAVVMASQQDYESSFLFDGEPATAEPATAPGFQDMAELSGDEDSDEAYESGPASPAPAEEPDTSDSEAERSDSGRVLNRTERRALQRERAKARIAAQQAAREAVEEAAEEKQESESTEEVVLLSAPATNRKFPSWQRARDFCPKTTLEKPQQEPVQEARAKYLISKRLSCCRYGNPKKNKGVKGARPKRGSYCSVTAAR
ncbi:hypothetical protein AC579_175 [Pseudocercospora musae]|uniref:Uncharacterized protein n=1 Tax=Pseudocercospora musae TaxID=113226 RepID=A0A139I118_9PEZI|nr:hypothetical protein AC579_175 [Pseudocercospora musae]